MTKSNENAMKKIMSLLDGKLELGAMVVGFTRPQDDVRKVGLVHRIRISLRFQTKSAMFLVETSIFALEFFFIWKEVSYFNLVI